MMANRQIERMMQKLQRFENTLSEMIFQPVAQVEMKWYKTAERLHQIPKESFFTSCENGEAWGGENAYCWFRGTYTPAKELEGKKLYLYPKTTGYEAMLWTNGCPKGIYAAKFIEGSHGNHYCDMLTMHAESGKPIDIALEYYAGNFCIGTIPLINEEFRTFQYEVGPADICVKDELCAEFLFDLKTLNQLAESLDKNNFRRADIIRTLIKVHETVYYSPQDTDEETFHGALREALPFLKESLAKKNSSTAPYAGIIGHSHMDTAWLWTVDETIKKCARTSANQLNLMEQYPEYLFVQSSACHTEMVREHYPELFERLKEAIAAGRYEPNGGVWVESDCNIPTGELIARQFLWGQRYTQKHFNYISDTFWLPDTFGYNAAIPQIMKQSGVKYFLTTKMDWNDTTKFPYDSFWWRGIDGTEVLTHFNKTHVWPDPKTLVEYVAEGKEFDNCIKEKNVTDKRLISFGFGDGGGGPQFEMLEMARRLEDLEGAPKTEYTTVSRFMQKLKQSMTDPSTFSGELYLELHRGTLTNQHQIKKNNRLAEIALHNLEYFTVRNAMVENTAASPEKINPLTGVLLMNQFHDILPGTCIPEVHEQSLAQTSKMIIDANLQSSELMKSPDTDVVTINNTTSFDRDDVVYLDFFPGKRLSGNVKQQLIENISGEKKLAVSGLNIKAYSSVCAKWETGDITDEKTPFDIQGNTLETPFASVQFDSHGYICSFKDKNANNRELCAENGYAFNTLLLAEDVPSAWDNWDVDADLEYKFKPVQKLLSREVIADGIVELRIRSMYELTAKSAVTQDMIFYADSPQVRFETQMNWQDHHRFLKTAFDTSIYANEARHEMQFGYIKRPTTRNNDAEKAKFEVCAHKYSDISETRYGFALMNDCKYGVSAHGSSLRLSLHKGGNRPDYKGDLGMHTCTYAILPHSGGFSAENVVKPAYLLNYKPFITEGKYEFTPLLSMNSEMVVAETIKPCEDEEKAYILRLYECEGATAHAKVSIPDAKAVVQTDLLENAVDTEQENEMITLSFRPFEIKTLKVKY